MVISWAQAIRNCYAGALNLPELGQAMKSTPKGSQRRIVAALVALFMTAVSATLASPTATAQEVTEPFFSVSPIQPADHMWGEGWLPDSDVQIDIDDPALGGAVDFTTSSPTDGDGRFEVFDLPFDIQAGQVVTVSQDANVKTHEVIDLTISGVDAAADTVSGIGAADTLTYVHEGDTSQVIVMSDGAGDWTADFGTAGFDIVPGMTIYAFQADQDWDQTQIDYYLETEERPGLKTIRANAESSGSVFAYGWEIGSSLTLTIEDPDTPLSPDLITSKEFSENPLFFDVAEWITIEPGQEVSLTDGTTTVEHIVGPLEITSADRATDVVTGIALPSIRVELIPAGTSSGEDAYYTDPEGDGTWQIELPAGTLAAAEWLMSNQFESTDPDEDSETQYDWVFPDDGYVFSGFAEPVDTDAVNLARAGRTVPLKFRVTTGAGDPVTDIADVAVTVTTLECELGTTEDQVEEYAAGNSGLQNLGDGYYQYNWKTPKSYRNSCKLLTLDIGDGVPHTAEFHFTR